LLDAFQSVLSRAHTKIDHQIDLERFSITDRINQLVDLLQLHKKLSFEQLFEGATSRGDLIVTFLALLEMTRLRMTRLEQEGPLQPISIELALVDAGVMEEAAASAEASFSSKPADGDALEQATDVEDDADEENALAARSGEVAPASGFEDDEPEPTDPDHDDQDEP
jgi:segregation and condensation protein A